MIVFNMEAAKTTFRPAEGLIPNPKARLREQVHEVMRFKQFSPRTVNGLVLSIVVFLHFMLPFCAAVNITGG